MLQGHRMPDGTAVSCSSACGGLPEHPGQARKVARTFQNIRLFRGMTVLENLLVAQHNTLMVASGYTFARRRSALAGYTRAGEAARSTRRATGSSTPT